MTIYDGLEKRNLKKYLRENLILGSGRNCHIEGVNGKKLIKLLKYPATKYWVLKRLCGILKESKFYARKS